MTSMETHGIQLDESQIMEQTLQEMDVQSINTDDHLSEDELKKMAENELSGFQKDLPSLCISFTLSSQEGVISAPAEIPLVYPSAVTFLAVSRLVQSLNQIPSPSQNLTGECLQRPEFQLLSAWFNSIFFYPMLIWFGEPH